MPKKTNDGTRPAPWFSSVNRSCFSPKPLASYRFLNLFLMPMCAPHNHNYGFSGVIKSGKAKKENEKTLRMIAKEQLALMKELKQLQTGWTTPVEDAASRAVELTIHFLKVQQAEQIFEYCGKVDNCPPKNYLSIFHNAVHLDKSPREMMELVIDLYEGIVELVFSTAPQAQLDDIKAAFDMVFEAYPALEIPEQSSWQRDVAWRICVGLMLEAQKRDSNEESALLISRLLNIPLNPGNQSRGSAAAEKQVSLDLSHLCFLLEQALRTDIEPPQLRSLYSLLIPMFQKGQIPGKILSDMHSNMEKKAEKLRREMLDSEKKLNSAEFLKQMGEIASLMEMQEELEKLIGKEETPR